MKKIIDKWWIAIIALLTIMVVISTVFAIKENNLNISLKNTIKEIKNENNSMQIKIVEINNKVLELQKVEEQKKINDKIKNLEEEKASIENEVEQLKNNKQELEKEIKSLKEDVIKEKGKAKTYPAGHLIAGEDIPLGKYKIYGGSSNFVVYSLSGHLEVNIILGTSLGVKEYIYTFKDGDKIEANSSFKLIEVK